MTEVPRPISDEALKIRMLLNSHRGGSIKAEPPGAVSLPRAMGQDYRYHAGQLVVDGRRQPVRRPR